MGARSGKRLPAADTVTAVQRLIQSDGISKAKAFKRVAKKTGRTPGSVAVAFYRGIGGTKTIKARKQRKARRTRRGSTDMRAALGRLARMLREQQAEMERLERQVQRFERIRQLLR